MATAFTLTGSGRRCAWLELWIGEPDALVFRNRRIFKISIESNVISLSRPRLSQALAIRSNATRRALTMQKGACLGFERPRGGGDQNSLRVAATRKALRMRQRPVLGLSLAVRTYPLDDAIDEALRV
jgi:hypothetical protein